MSTTIREVPTRDTEAAVGQRADSPAAASAGMGPAAAVGAQQIGATKSAAAAPDCSICGETACTRKHDCQGCESNDAVKQCDREHLTCDECSWVVGDGPDARVVCARCEQEQDEADADAERIGDEMRDGER